MDDRQGWATNLKEEEVKERMKTKNTHKSTTSAID